MNITPSMSWIHNGAVYGLPNSWMFGNNGWFRGSILAGVRDTSIGLERDRTKPTLIYGISFHFGKRAVRLFYRKPTPLIPAYDLRTIPTL